MTLPFHEEEGWIGAFTRAQAEGAFPNGTPIVKVMCEQGDAHPLGTKGKVLGSWRHHSIMNNEVFYFVEWETMPRVAVGVIGSKIERDSS